MSCQHLLFLSAYWFCSSSSHSIKSIKINFSTKQSFKINYYYSFLKSSEDSAEFESWLQEKQRLNQNIKKVCRERKIQIKIHKNFMYIKPTNILFCLNPKVKLKHSIEIYLTDKKSRWELQPGYLTSFSCQVCVDSIVQYTKGASHLIFLSKFLE